MSKRPIGQPTTKPQRVTWRLLKGWLVKGGYPSVTLCNRNKKGKNQFGVSIHILILRAFVGPPKKNQEARHLDDVKTNSVLSNLQWGTRRQNILDSVRNGRHGGAKTSAKLKGRPRPPEFSEALRRAWVRRKQSGWTLSKRARQKLSRASLGRKLSKEHRTKISLGVRASKEKHREKN